MTRLGAWVAAIAGLAAAWGGGTAWLNAGDEPPSVRPAYEPPVRRGIDDLKPTGGPKPYPPIPYYRGRPGTSRAGVLETDGASKPDKSIPPVKCTGPVAKLETAVTPRPLSDAVKKGLEYLVKNQQKDGGWNQGGGWRTNLQGGGRIEGPNVEDPSDVANTAFALLALIRAGNTPTEGPYRESVRKGLLFILKEIEKSDSESLFVTDIRGTQLQSKIGLYVDTFMANWVLAELRGKSGDLEDRLVAALEKTMTKIIRHQQPDGTFAGNAGWASTLSVGIANKSIARARERGAVVPEVVLERILAQSKAAAEGRPVSGLAGLRGAGGRLETVPAAPAGAAAADAGIRLYSAAQGATNAQDVINSLRLDAAKARQVIKDAKASAAEKQQAQQTIEKLAALERENDRLQMSLRSNARDERFLAGFGNNGGEEFLSFLNISETLVLEGGKEWESWNQRMIQGLEKAQDSNGSWQGHHCITGRTFCTAAALLVLMADRTPFPAEVIAAAREKRSNSSGSSSSQQPQQNK